MPVLKTMNLCKSYGDGSALVKALTDVSLEVSEGDFLAIMGTSGCGKSTLLNMLGGLDKPSSGIVTYNGTDMGSLKPDDLALLRRRSFGFVFQFFHLIPILTVRENIILPVLMDGKKPDNQYIDKLIDTLGLRNKLQTFSSKLSGGQQQRVAIARALSAKPSVVFADEPTGNLDSRTRNEIMDIFKNTADQFGQTLIIVTHDSFVASSANRIIELEDGLIKSDSGE